MSKKITEDYQYPRKRFITGKFLIHQSYKRMCAVIVGDEIVYETNSIQDAFKYCKERAEK